MATDLLTPPSTADPRTTLRLSQAAPSFITSTTSSTLNLPYPLSLLTTPESQEKWQITSNLFLACLRTGDTDTAYSLLSLLTKRFGTVNERVMALQGLYQEAIASDEKDLEGVLKGYDEVLHEDDTLFAIRKRKAALLRSLGRTQACVTTLVELVDTSPTDAEAWAELADVYVSLGSWEQAIFCLEETLLVMPNAWNMHARLAEVLVLSVGKEEGAEKTRVLAEAMRRFCRSVELCEGYLRGFYGLKVATDKLMPLLSSAKSSKNIDSGLPLPSLQTTQKLNQLATAKLSEIVRRSKVGEKGWDGYSEAELIAAKALLDVSSADVAR